MKFQAFTIHSIKIVNVSNKAISSAAFLQSTFNKVMFIARNPYKKSFVSA